MGRKPPAGLTGIKRRCLPDCRLLEAVGGNLYLPFPASRSWSTPWLTVHIMPALTLWRPWAHLDHSAASPISGLLRSSHVQSPFHHAKTPGHRFWGFFGGPFCQPQNHDPIHLFQKMQKDLWWEQTYGGLVWGAGAEEQWTLLGGCVLDAWAAAKPLWAPELPTPVSYACALSISGLSKM